MKPRGYLINGNFYDENISDSELDLVTPLYLEEPQTKPLSDEDIADMVCSGDYWKVDGLTILSVDFDKFARAIEERHGIK